MKIRICPSCGGRLIAEVMDDTVSVRCNACGQKLGTFDRADKPIVINDMEMYPLATSVETPPKPCAKHSSKFFRNTMCEYFPCHKVDDVDNFNCLFCYCPLHHMADCGGNYETLPNGIKDCTKCLLPHIPAYYDYVVAKLKGGADNGGK